MDSWKAVGVPGTVMGLETARVRYGTWSRAVLLAQTIKLAREGFVLDEAEAGAVAAAAPKLQRDHVRSP